jgi:hypothetical protein
MEAAIHYQVLGSAFAIAVLIGAVAHRTNFCTMGAVSDWVNMGDTGRMRAWLLAIAVALGGVLLLEASGRVSLSGGTFPPYRTESFAWLRYLLGGLMFGVGMTLASGCGNKTLVRIGGGNLKSLVVLAIACVFAYLMLWTTFFERAFLPWIMPTTISLAGLGAPTQELGDVIGALVGAAPGTLHLGLGAAVTIGLLVFVFASREFRGSHDNLLGGTAVGLAVVAGWYLTGGPTGAQWREFADMATEVPSRVQVQSFTFISPMGDTLRWLMNPTQLTLINFGVVALGGVIAGSLLYALATRRFRIEWFANGADFANHAIGGMLMGIGGVLSMGCTVGQAITGFSTLALGSILTFVAIVAGAAATMKIQYWRLMREA